MPNLMLQVISAHFWCYWSCGYVRQVGFKQRPYSYIPWQPIAWNWKSQKESNRKSFKTRLRVEMYSLTCSSDADLGANRPSQVWGLWWEPLHKLKIVRNPSLSWSKPCQETLQHRLRDFRLNPTSRRRSEISIPDFSYSQVMKSVLVTEALCRTRGLSEECLQFFPLTR